MCPTEHLRGSLIVPIVGERPAGHPATEQRDWGAAGLACGSAPCRAWAGGLAWASWGNAHPTPAMGASAGPPSRRPDTAGQWGVDVDTQLHDPKPRPLVLNPSLLVLSLPHLCSRKSASFITGPQSEGTGRPPHPPWLHLPLIRLGLPLVLHPPHLWARTPDQGKPVLEAHRAPPCLPCRRPAPPMQPLLSPRV